MTELSELEKFRRDLALRELDKTYDLTTDLVKWLGATLLARNGAAMIALLNSSELRRLLFEGPGWVFAVGVILPIVGTIVVVRSLVNLGDKLGRQLWKGGNLDARDIDEFTLDFDGKTASKASAAMFGLSIACFVVGSVWSASLLVSVPKHEKAITSVTKK